MSAQSRRGRFRLPPPRDPGTNQDRAAGTADLTIVPAGFVL